MSDRATLSSLIESIGTEIMRVVVAPAGLQVGLSNPVIDDPGEPTPIDSGDLVFAVGTAADSGNALRLLDTAGRAGAAAVAFRSSTPLPAGLLQAAERAAVALLWIEPAMAWSQLHTLVRSAVATAGVDGGSDELSGPIGDLFSLANAIAAMVGGPTTIEDPRSTVLAFSSLDEPIDEARRATILGRRVPDDWLQQLQNDGVFRRLWAAEGVIRVEYPKIQRRLAIAIRAGGEILGSIWVAEDARPLDTAAERALTEAAGLAALHLIRARSSDDLVRTRRSGLLRSLLDGNAVAELLADAVKVAVDCFVTVIAFRLPEGSPGELAAAGRRASRLVDLYCESARRPAASALIGPTLYLLIADREAPGRERFEALAKDLLGERHALLPPDTLAGIGSTLPGLASAPASREDADRVLAVLPSLGPGLRLAAVETVQSHVTLARLCEIARREPGLLEGPIEALVRLDAQGKSHHVETLRAFLDTFGDVASAARSIGVHPNTFRFRMRRLVDISGINLDDPDERLVAHLQLRIRRAG